MSFLFFYFITCKLYFPFCYLIYFICKSLLIEIGNVYKFNCAYGISPETVMIHKVNMRSVMLKSVYEDLTPHPFKEDIKGFINLTKLICENNMPMDLKCLIQYLKNKKNWRYVILSLRQMKSM